MDGPMTSPTTALRDCSYELVEVAGHGLGDHLHREDAQRKGESGKEDKHAAFENAEKRIRRHVEDVQLFRCCNRFLESGTGCGLVDDVENLLSPAGGL